MGEIFLPVLSHFQNENTWIASDGRLRFKVTPGDGLLTAEIWEGPWSYDLSTIEEQQTFPMEDDGIEVLRAWLREKEGEVNARPKRTMEEDWARRR
ncbi:conserved hypothetical protein [uncultured Eubacteriales bacterium]|uniref:Uncharacterized protein n=1 Tax=uncultured Eubacteriales bacterium TaxID=172733 RepID=A0A212KAV6_9FIRM|nr:conserved hypothetical protein [uncultured Eubacteriales bacterium]